MITELVESSWFLIDNLGWALLNSIWQLSILALLIGCLLSFLRSSLARYRTAYVGLMLMAITPVASFVWSVSTKHLSADSYSTSFIEPTVATGDRLSADPLESWPQDRSGAEQIFATKEDNQHESSSRTSTASKLAAARHSYVVWLVPCWLCGVLVLSVRQIGGWFLAVRVVRHSELLKMHPARDCLDRLTQKMQIKRIVRLFSSKEVTTPMVLGVFRPCLIVPASLLTGLTPDQLTAIFAHELAHLRRHDFLQNLLQTLIETLLFFHPAVWWIARVIRQEREHLCDDLSVDVVGQPIGLAEALLAIQSLGGGTKQIPVAQAATGNRDSAMIHRIRRLVSPQSARERVSGVSAPVALRAVVAAVLIASSLSIAPLAIAIQGQGEKNIEKNTEEKKTDEVAKEKIEPWEISKLYEAAFLRSYLELNEALPKPIVVPAVSGKVLDPDGKPASGASIVSHTPRHWIDLNAALAISPHDEGGVRKSKPNGTFGIPQRTEPYRVMFVHESGVANLSHEELLRAKGVVTLQKWASVSGTLKLEGKPQANEKVVLNFDTLKWSYSRGGPRVTTSFQTTTDQDGNFSFDRVPPLAGIAKSMDGHAAVYQCESGKKTQIEIGAGKTITGKVDLSEEIKKDKLRVYARNHLLPIPYPKDWTEKVTEKDREAWQKKWLQTAEGYELSDKNFVLVNSSVPGSIAEDGTFTIHGVTEKPMVLVIAIPGEAILLEHPFDCTGAEGNEMSLGTLLLSDAQSLHDHQHVQVKQNGELADKPQLPKLIVKTVDSKGNPVPGTGVLFYDRNSRRAGQKQEFEAVSKRTDESGVADFGVMPNGFGCLQLNPSNDEFAECYTLISATLKTCTQAKPVRANVQTEVKDGIVTVTFTLTQHVDLEFNIVDDVTNEIVFWPEIYFQDSATDRWWQFALVDGSQNQHNFIPISPEITRETMRISATGYETKVFQLPDELDRSKPIRRDLRLKPMPDIELRLLLPDGTPAEKAKLTVEYQNGLECLQIQESLSDAQGIITAKFPPNADLGTYRFEHPGGMAELSMHELLDEAKKNPGKLIKRDVQLGKLKKQNKPVTEETAANVNSAVKPISWRPTPPQKISVTKGSARVLDDHSIRLEGSVESQEVTAHFAFDKPTVLKDLRLELLPVDTPAGRQFGRGGDTLLLFDVKAGVVNETGQWKSRDFSSCISLLNPDDQTTMHCIDYLSDTGWTVPALPESVEAHTLVLTFSEVVTLQPNEQLVLSVDSGGSQELSVLNRIRFAFHEFSR